MPERSLHPLWRANRETVRGKSNCILMRVNVSAIFRGVKINYKPYHLFSSSKISNIACTIIEGVPVAWAAALTRLKLRHRTCTLFSLADWYMCFKSVGVRLIDVSCTWQRHYVYFSLELVRHSSESLDSAGPLTVQFKSLFLPVPSLA